MLRAVDVVASEDTRKTGLLLKHFEIKKPQIAFHEHNEAPRRRRDCWRCCGGAIGGAGDQRRHAGHLRPWLHAGAPPHRPQRAHHRGSGARGVVVALVLSGLPVHAFTFRGFAPRKPGPRRRFLEVDRDAPHTLIFYESPYRLRRFCGPRWRSMATAAPPWPTT